MMAKRSPTTFLKRQREMDKKRKNELKRQRRLERRDQPKEPDRIEFPPELDEDGLPLD